MTRLPGADATQPQRVLSLLARDGRMRLSDFLRHGITAATIRRLEQKGRVVRVERGLYELRSAALDADHALAQAARLAPGATVCLTSAAAWHGLIDAAPPSVYLAVGLRAPRPRMEDPPLHVVRFGPRALDTGVEVHVIADVEVRIYDPAKTIVDLFRCRHQAGMHDHHGIDVAIDALRGGLRTGKALPAKITRYAEEVGLAAVVTPYLDAMTA